MERIILHSDLNNFYASVECMKKPELKAFPVAVCGDEEKRHGIVLAKNEKAKLFGVTTGETIWQARLKCPNLVIVQPNYRDYTYFSKRASEIYYRYTDKVEPFGLDECWLDVTGSTSLFGSGEEIAHKIRTSIKNELGLTVSVGVSFNKIFAKLASDMKKPDAVTVLSKDDFREKIWNLPASDMLGVGRKTYMKLTSCGIYTIGQIAKRPPEFFKYKLGKCGLDIWLAANGLDESEVLERGDDGLDKSCGHGMTTPQDLLEDHEVWRVMLELSQDIGHRLSVSQKRASGISIAIRDNRFITKQWQTKLSLSTGSPSIIAKEAFSLFKANYAWKYPIRAVTVRAIDLISVNTPEQIGLFDDTDSVLKTENLDKTVESIRRRFGKGAICNATLL